MIPVGLYDASLLLGGYLALRADRRISVEPNPFQSPRGL
jgi:hypothetical protein